MTTRRAGFIAGVCVMAGLAMVWPHAQGAGRGAAPAQGAQGAGGRRGGQQAQPMGTMTPLTPDSRGWGWQVKSLMSPDTPRPLYNKAKELLLQDKTVTSFTISSFNPEQYCEIRKHFDFVWFEVKVTSFNSDGFFCDHHITSSAF